MTQRIVIFALTLCLVLFYALPLSSAPLTQSPPASGTVNANANLRAGPGTNYAKVGFAPVGTKVQIVACNTGCTWYQLNAEQWIAAFLVDPDDGPGPCDASYPTVCIPPPPPDLDCGDLSVSNFQVVGSDPHLFDGDDDGIGCESSSPPGGPTPTFTPTPTLPPNPPGDTPTPTPTKVCDYANYSGACIPPYPPDLDCGEIPFKRFQSIGSDPHNFDGDNDGLACES